MNTVAATVTQGQVVTRSAPQDVPAQPRDDADNLTKERVLERPRECCVGWLLSVTKLSTELCTQRVRPADEGVERKEGWLHTFFLRPSIARAADPGVVGAGGIVSMLGDQAREKTTTDDTWSR